MPNKNWEWPHDGIGAIWKEWGSPEQRSSSHEPYRDVTPDAHENKPQWPDENDHTTPEDLTLSHARRAKSREF